jgi:hypothetical protein
MYYKTYFFYVFSYKRLASPNGTVLQYRTESQILYHETRSLSKGWGGESAITRKDCYVFRQRTEDEADLISLIPSGPWVGKYSKDLGDG